MSQEDFQRRLERLGARQTIEGGAGVPSVPARSNGLAWRPFLLGAVSSAIILWLFANIQIISDLAPDSVKNGDAAGMFGLPIALLTVAWLILIVTRFVGSILQDALRMQGFVMPSPFITGAFLGLAAGFGAMNVLDVFPAGAG